MYMKKELELNPAFGLEEYFSQKPSAMKAPLKPCEAEIHVLVELPIVQPFKKARLVPSTLRTLLTKIDAFDWQHIFDMESLMEVPFPSLCQDSNRFRLNDVGCFQY